MTDFDDAFDKRHDPQTGGYIKAQPDVIKDIKRLTIYRKGKFWIGKTSGGEERCRKRWSAKYKSDKMNKMAIVYESSSQDFASDMEGDMIDEFWNEIKNEVRGSPGKLPDNNPPYVVYIAWKE